MFSGTQIIRDFEPSEYLCLYSFQDLLSYRPSLNQVQRVGFRVSFGFRDLTLLSHLFHSFTLVFKYLKVQGYLLQELGFRDPSKGFSALNILQSLWFQGLGFGGRTCFQ